MGIPSGLMRQHLVAIHPPACKVARISQCQHPHDANLVPIAALAACRFLLQQAQTGTGSQAGQVWCDGGHEEEQQDGASRGRTGLEERKCRGLTCQGLCSHTTLLSSASFNGLSVPLAKTPAFCGKMHIPIQQCCGGIANSLARQWGRERPHCSAICHAFATCAA